MPSNVNRHIEVLLPSGANADSDTLTFKLTPRSYEGTPVTLTPTTIGTVAGISSVTSINVSCTAAVGSGTLVTVLASNRTGIISSVTDSKGNTYTVDKAFNAGGNESASIASAILTTPLTNTDTWTVNYNVATVRSAITVVAWTGTGVTFLGVDKTAQDSAPKGDREGMGGGTTAVTTIADELVLMVLSSNSTPVGGNGNLLVNIQSSGGGTPAGLSAKYYTTSAMGTQTIAGITGSSTVAYVGVTATYKLSMAAAPSTDSGTVSLAFAPSAVETFTHPLIPVPTQIHFAGSTSTPNTGANFSLGDATTGDLVIALIASDGVPPSSISDDKGNTWTLDVIKTTTKSICIASSKITSTAWAGGFNGLTVVFPSAVKYVVDVWKWTGVPWQTGVVDVTANDSGSSGASGVMSGGVTPAIAQVEELVITAFASGGNISGGNGTMLDAGSSSGGTGPVFLSEKYLLPASAGIQSISGVTGDPSAWVGATATYKISAPIAATDANTINLRFGPSAIEDTGQDAGTATLALRPDSVEVYSGTIVYTDGWPPVRLKFTPVRIMEQYEDSGSVYLDLDCAADDCHAILTPHWHETIRKRWSCDVTNRWHVVAIEDRWLVWMIGVAVDNPCPDPTFF